MVDADMDRFIRELKDTPAGLRLRLATSESHIAIHRIHAGFNGSDRAMTYHALQIWRRQYIKACQLASSALTDLAMVNQWPPDGTAAMDYVWRPKRPA